MKKYLGIIALGLALTASAFTPKHSETNSKLTGQWFLFNGNPAIPAEVNDPLKYSSEAASSCPNTGSNRCEVNAEPGSGGHPDLSQIHQIKNKS